MLTLGRNPYRIPNMKEPTPSKPAILPRNIMGLISNLIDAKIHFSRVEQNYCALTSWFEAAAHNVNETENQLVKALEEVLKR